MLGGTSLVGAPYLPPTVVVAFNTPRSCLDSAHCATTGTHRCIDAAALMTMRGKQIRVRYQKPWQGYRENPSGCDKINGNHPLFPSQFPPSPPSSPLRHPWSVSSCTVLHLSFFISCPSFSSHPDHDVCPQVRHCVPASLRGVVRSRAPTPTRPQRSSQPCACRAPRCQRSCLQTPSLRVIIARERSANTLIFARTLKFRASNDRCSKFKRSPDSLGQA